MNLVDVTRLSNGPISDLINWLQCENLTADPLRCLPCNRGMVLDEREQTTLMDIYGKVYIRIIRAQVIFITSICFRDLFGQLLDNSTYKKNQTKGTRPSPGFLIPGCGFQILLYGFPIVSGT